jgi:septum formation protein
LNLVQPLILASTSRYRRELLSRFKLPFEVLSPGVDEAHLAGEPALYRAERLAYAKALAVANQRPDAAVIGSDQVAVCNELVLDKSRHAAGAIAQLQLLSGQKAAFHTAVAVVCKARGFEERFVNVTTVRMRELTQIEIERYVGLEQPFDCAGSFRSESLGSVLFEQMISDDPTGLVGLPLIRLAASLRALGYALP